MPEENKVVDLTILPDHIRKSAEAVAENYGEKLIGYKPLKSHPNAHTWVVAGWIVITDSGYYEFDKNGVCMRAGVLHKF